MTTQTPGKKITKETEMGLSDDQRDSMDRENQHNGLIKEMVVLENNSYVTNSTPIHQQQQQEKKLYNGYTTDIHHQTARENTPYNSYSNLTTTTATIVLQQHKVNDTVSIDSMFGVGDGSIHESQSSRKSLTKN